VIKHYILLFSRLQVKRLDSSLNQTFLPEKQTRKTTKSRSKQRLRTAFEIVLKML
jgi:hypothetical protein